MATSTCVMLHATTEDAIVPLVHSGVQLLTKDSKRGKTSAAHCGVGSSTTCARVRGVDQSRPVTRPVTKMGQELKAGDQAAYTDGEGNIRNMHQCRCCRKGFSARRTIAYDDRTIFVM